MKAVLLSLGVCAALGGCVGYGGGAYGYGGYGAYGSSYPAYGSYYGGSGYAPAYQGGGRRGYGDRDRDGAPNRMDRDRDGDGVRNRDDSRPNDPRRY